MAAAAVAPGSSQLQVEAVPCLSDNFAWLLHEPTSGVTAIVDPSEPGPVIAALDARGWKLDYIINTHHHWDHTGGNQALKDKYKATVVGPAADKDRIPGIDIPLGEDTPWSLGPLEVRTLDTPGHTRGHVSYHIPAAGAVFTGDTLFALGCGRLFEGDAPTMWTSLSKLKALPRETRVYCGHEYTAANAKFAISVDPDNQALKQRKLVIDQLRSEGKATVPSTLGEELDTNPFLRPSDPRLRAGLGMADATDWQVFGAVRSAKDRF